jgi:glycosyltransferase involved in cell wall biosynthesis
MRVAVNFGNTDGFGARSVALSVLESLVTLAPHDTFEVWGPPEITSRSNLMLHRSSGIARKAVTELLAMPYAFWHRPPDCLFSLGDTSTPVARVPHLLLLQQALLAYEQSAMDFPMTVAFRCKLRLMELYFKATLRNASMIVVQSSEMKSRLSSRWNLDPEQIVVVPSGVEKLEEDEPPFLPNDEVPFVFYPAAAYPHKNHAILVEIMRQLTGDCADIKCVLTVEPESVPQFMKAAARAGVLTRFDFIGSVSPVTVRRLMRAAIALVMPSKLESFGLPYYEAMVEGCAIIASDRPFAREACAEAALYADPDDCEAFARHVVSLRRSPSLLETRRQLARQRAGIVVEPWSRTGTECYRLLQRLVSDRGTAQDL